MYNPATQTTLYDVINHDELDRLEKRHAWIVEPIYRASSAVREMPFYNYIANMRSVHEFKAVATQLYFHSATFPKVMGLMLGLTPLSQNYMMPFYAKHAFGEAVHHQLLLQWMLRHQLLADATEIVHVITAAETNSCVNLAYQLAAEQDRDKWLVTSNSGIERCSNDFFKAIAPKMHALGAGDFYFDTHVEADEHHSIAGLDFIEVQDPFSPRGKQLIAKALEGIASWADMLRAWVGIDYHPRFNLEGALIEPSSANLR